MNAEVSNRANSQIPQELTGPLPRNVQLRAGGKLVWTILAFGLLVAGVIFVAWNGFDTVQQFKLRAALRASGQLATGTVSLPSFGVSNITSLGRIVTCVLGDGPEGKGTRSAAGGSVVVKVTVPFGVTERPLIDGGSPLPVGGPLSPCSSHSLKVAALSPA